MPLAKDNAHRRWRNEWLGEIKKTREMDQDFRRQIIDDKIYTCEKHFDPGDIEICKAPFTLEPTHGTALIKQGPYIQKSSTARLIFTV